ncbi:tetratricopeptide repeat protein [Hymenobacter jejuensis]|uniref:Tetratricopeptide repeat protein n=1 Tax=Hymenobacter jejuensis TaxID=2502781 RepID=A0A5B7ZXA1_9BACT|nr:tetratricopeptide repeat protein [Hymenobacter jejuensis]QDA59143.1 tetratricopeptide repeat protein [Hymenobacter jejuensis]
MRSTILPLLSGALVLLLTTQCATTVETEKPRTLTSQREMQHEPGNPRYIDSTGAAATAPDAKLSATSTVAPPRAAPAAAKTAVPVDYKAEIRAADVRLKASPRDADALLARAKAKSNLKDYREAMLDYNATLRITPTNADAYYNRGLTHLKLKEYNASISDFSKALKYRPDDKEAFFGRGTAKMQMFNFKGAIPDFTRAIELDPAYADAYEARGISYSSINKPTEARADLEKAAKLNPKITKTLRRYSNK